MSADLYPARTLESAYGALELRLNLPGTFKDLYVERPARCVTDLATALAIADPGAPVKRVFAGHGGSGKTTELFRLLNLPAVKRGFKPVYYSIMADYGIPDVQLIDLLVTMALETAKQVTLKVAEEKLVRDWLMSLGSEVERTSVRQLAIGISKLLKIEVGWRQELRQKVGPRVQEVVAVIDALALKVVQATKKRLLVVVDDLEKADLTAALNVFCENPSQLAAPNCDTIFTVPLSLVHSEHCVRVANQFGHPLVLPVIAVRHPDGRPNEAGVKFLLDVLHRRAAPALFEEGVARYLVGNSGGVVFDLLDTARQAVLRALASRRTTVAQDVAQEVVRDLSRSYWRRLDSKHFETLIRVATKHYLDPREEDLPLLHTLAVLEYEDDPTWHDVHPAVKRVLENRGMIVQDEHGQWRDAREVEP